MSHEEDLKAIKHLVGKECERTLAINSLKLRFDCDIDERGKSYIWIDPPWLFVKDQEVIASAYDCPLETESFRKWSDHLNPLNKTKLVSFEYFDDGNFVLTFKDNYHLYIPFDPEEDEYDDSEEDEEYEEDYEHWYIHHE